VKPYADHFSRLASGYARSRPRYPAELFSYLAGLTSRHELAWDCAAGNGQATVPLAQWFRRVIGTDASGAMLGQAQSHPAVEYREAPAERSGLDSASVDLVTVAQALHWLDVEAFYREVRRVLVPGGVLAVWTYGVNHVDLEAADRVLFAFYTDVVGPFWPADRRHVESGYLTLPFPFPELSPPGFSMQVHWTLSELLAYVRTWSATQRYKEAKGRDPVEQLERQLAPVWGDRITRRVISWPLSLRVGRYEGQPLG
jgi:SAM-dependent methyltransferase